MDRRAFLVGVAGGLAGCSSRGGRDDDPGGAARDGGTPQATPSESSHTPTGTPGIPDVCEVPPKDVGIEAIVGPAFAEDWSDVSVDSYEPLADESVVVGLDVGVRPRAYPLTVLWWHEIVNDAIPGEDGDRPVLVTYCSLCASGMVAERTVDGDPALFGVSGRLWRPPAAETREEADGIFGADLPEGEGPDARVQNELNLVLYDAATGSYWSQLLAAAICGPRQGQRLSLLPATATTWGEWRETHPGTEVLLPPPHSRVLNPPYPGNGPPGG